MSVPGPADEGTTAPDAATRAVRLATVAIGCVLAATAVFVVTRHRDVPAISAHVTDVVVGDPRQVVVTIEVDKAPLASATCQVTAFGASGRSVGRLIDIPIGPNARNQRRVTKTVTVPTEETAATAQVAECTVTRTR